MKKKKGFTLIELLAIIVILAIIAVITVPIILGIIEEAKIKSIIDSAYGYKDAINKYYMAKLLTIDDYDIQNGTYMVNASTGYLVGTEVLEIKVSGKFPEGGAVEMYDNQVNRACLQFGEYAASVQNDKVDSVAKGICSGTVLLSENGSNIALIYEHKGDTQTKSALNMTVGDYVKIENDGFYVASQPSNGKVLLLSEYNLSSTPLFRQESSNYEKVAFSDSMYWGNKLATVSDPSNCPSASYCNLYSTESYIYVYDSNSNLYNPIQSYKSYLQTIVGTNNLTNIRPMSYSEADSIKGNSWAHNQEYWIGSILDNSNFEVGYMYTSSNIGALGSMQIDLGNVNVYPGIRPTIEILTSSFTNDQVSLYASKGSSQTKSVSNVAVGDYVTIANEGFYVIKKISSTKILILPEYNISQLSIFSQNALWRQTSNNDYNRVSFSGTNYWIHQGTVTNTIATVSDPNTCPTNYYCNLYPDEQAIYIYDSNSTLYNPIMNYKLYLDSIVGSGMIMNIRPMAYYEADSIKSNSWAHNQEYWLGSGGSTGEVLFTTVHYMNSQGNTPILLYSNEEAGVRPIIEVSLAIF